MKRSRILLLVLIGLVLSDCTTKRAKNSLTEENLRGKVKILTESSYRAIDMFGNVMTGELLHKTVHKYNDRGNITEENIYGADGNLIHAEFPSTILMEIKKRKIRTFQMEVYPENISTSMML